MSDRRVLIADDTEDLLLLLRMMMERSGATVVGLARDGDEALRCWHELRPPELFAVILDQRMPGRSGLDVAREILAEQPDQRVVLFSAHVDEAMVAEAESIGVTAVVHKQQILQLPSLPALRAADPAA